MAKMEGIIKAEITRLARREVRSVFRPLKREVRQMRVKLSGLSKGIGSLNRMTKELHLEEAQPKLEATPEEVKASRLTPDRIRSLRNKLGLSQRGLGILTGVSLGAVQSWEKGKFKPQGEKRAVLVALRRLRKREVRKLLEQQKASAQEKPKLKAKPKRRARRMVSRRKRPARRR